MKKLILAITAAVLLCGAAAGLTACGDKQCVHNYEEDVQRTVAATCHSDGIKYLVCSECGDEKSETLTERPAHDYGEGENAVWIKVDETRHARQCIAEGCGYIDGESAAEHNFTEDTTKLYIPATCHSDGTRYLVCADCGEQKSETVTERPAHDYGDEDSAVWVKLDENNHAKKCLVGGCGHVDSENPVAHNFVTDTSKTGIPATCHSDGIKYLVCADCGEEKTEADTNRPEHDFGEGEDIVWIKLDETYHAKKCITDGCVQLDTANKSEHNFVADTSKTDIPATCHSDGTKYLVCADCGEEKTEADTNRPEHDFGGEWLAEADGHHKACKNEGCTQTDANVEHRWNDGEVITPPTDTADGSMKIVCGDCGYESTRVIPALNHIKGDTLVYGEDGATHWYPCINPEHTVCDVKFDEQNHNYCIELTEQSKPATCKEDGIKVMACECGATEEDVISKTTVEHTWDDGRETKPASCQEKGEITFSCTVCGETRTEELNKLEHNYGEGEDIVWIKVDEGYHAKTCLFEGCGYVDTENAVPHNFIADTSKTDIPATCHSDGIKYMICAECGEEKAEADTERPAHDFGEWQTDADGHYKICQNEDCGEHSEKVAHTFEEEIVQATFWADGSITRTCSECGKSETETLERKNSTAADTDDADWKFGTVNYHFPNDEDQLEYFIFSQITDKNDNSDGFVKDGTEIKNTWFCGANFDTFICIAYTFKEDVDADISVSFKGIGGDDGILSDYSLRIGFNETPEWGDRGTEYTVNKTHSFNAGDTVYFIFKHETDGWDQGNYSITINRVAEIQN